MIVIGIDPGGRYTGLVARRDNVLVEWEVIDRLSPRVHPPSDSARVDGIRAVCSLISSWEFDHFFAGPACVAIEDLVDPTPQMGMMSVRGLLGTAEVIGAVLSRWPKAVMVPPGGHGAVPDGLTGPLLDAYMAEQYPAGLIGTRERGAYQGRLRHCRSAWDVAGAALVQLRREEV